MSGKTDFIRPMSHAPTEVRAIETAARPKRQRIRPGLLQQMLDESPAFRALAQGRTLTGLSAFYEKGMVLLGFSLGSGVRYVELDFDDPHIQDPRP